MARYLILSYVDMGFALSIIRAFWWGEDSNRAGARGGRRVADYQGNDGWFFPIPATFVVAPDGRVAARFVDPDYRRRMAIDDLIAALRHAQTP